MLYSFVMASLVVWVVLVVNGVVALFTPWVSVTLAYLVAVMAPQYIWWWDLGDQRLSYAIMVPVLIGFGIGLLGRRVRIKDLGTPINWLVLFLWFSFTVAYLFGPYVNVVNASRFFDPGVVFSTTSKALLTYFVAAMVINDEKKLKAVCLVILVTTVYMTYWANAQYFVHHVIGRVHGPQDVTGHGIYGDENEFAVLFVVGAPFVYYLGQYLRSRIIRWASWVVVLFSWHAIFLTASRGALVAVGAVLVAFAVRSNKKTFAAIVMAAFVAAYVLEAGSVMKGRADTITQLDEGSTKVSEGTASSEARLAAWAASIRMMEAHPLIGVGYASFGQAFPDYSDVHPHMAHNTFFQIGGECGVLAGLAYLVLLGSTIYRLRKNGTVLSARGAAAGDGRFYYCLNEACFLAIIGFSVCSMFLSLDTYEEFYYLLLLANAVLCQSARWLENRDTAASSVEQPVTVYRAAG